LNVSVSPGSLAAGTYNGTITVTTGGAAGGPQSAATIGVTLIVTPAAQMLSVARELITTAVGTSWAFPGNGKPAKDAPLGDEWGIAVDPSGVVYFTDFFNAAVFKIDQAGIITTVAGNGITGFSGDGGPATEAALQPAARVALGPDGSLYISDQGNFRIRKVDTNGIITTVAGNGRCCSAADGVPATAALIAPGGLAVDRAGVVYFADITNNLVRALGTDGILRTIAGNGQCPSSTVAGKATASAICKPGGVTGDSNGKVFVSAQVNESGLSANIIDKITPDGSIALFGGGAREIRLSPLQATEIWRPAPSP
jgi:sugar lactone lactonase YvrE